MAKTRTSAKTPESEEPTVTDKNRQAFLSELDGKIPVATVREAGKRAVRVDAPEDDETPGVPKLESAAEQELAEVLSPQATTGVDDRKTFMRAKKRSPWVFIVLGLVLLAGLTVVGLLFFTRGATFDAQQVELSFVVPEQVASGDSLSISIRYHNNEAVGIRTGRLSVSYPDGFTVDTTSPEATGDAHGTFEIGAVAAGAVGEVTIHGKILGQVGDTAKFQATLSYRPENFSSDFEATASRDVAISSSTVALSMTGPTKVAPGGTGSWTVTYENTSDEDLQNLQIAVTAPTDLTITGGTPKPTEGKLTWRVGTVKAGQKGTIVFTGKTLGAAGDSLDFSATAVLVNGTATEQQATTTFLTTIVASALTVSVAANGVDTNSTIKPGDAIGYAIRIENKGDAEVTEAQVMATFNGQLFNLAARQDQAKGDLKDSTITWTKKLVPGLATIAPGDVVTILLTVPSVAPVPAKGDADRNPQGSVSVAFQSPDIPTGQIPPTVLITKVATTMTFGADARYYTDAGATLGTGPIPPKVGQTTTYRVTWTASSTTNDVSSFTATAVLPTSVLWTGKNISRDAGDITFDPVSRTITWSINKIPGGTGSRYPILTASFEVSITPAADQVGSVVVLTESSTATGTDAFTSEKVSATISSLTTDIPNDPYGAGDGAVLP